MQIEFGRSTLSLARDGLLALRDALGTRILCHEGAIWVTQEGDIRDIIIGPGDAFTIRAPGLTVVTAVQPSKLTLIESGGAGAACAHRGEPASPVGGVESAACA
jgi:hypothetical protein